MQLVIGVDIDQLGLSAELLEEAQGLFAEVAALSGHENDGHGFVADPNRMEGET